MLCCAPRARPRVGDRGHGLPFSEEASNSLGLGFFFRERCPWSALLVGPERDAEIAQLWGAVRTHRVKKALQEPGDPNSPSLKHAAISIKIAGNHSSLSPSGCPGAGSAAQLQGQCQAAAGCTHAPVCYWEAGAVQGDGKGPSLIACFSREPQAALGRGVLSPCQPSCLRNYCVLPGNKGFSQHRLSWC